MDNIYYISSDGYGIHTFELKCLALSSEQTMCLKQRICRFEHIKEKLAGVTKSLKYNDVGMRIELHTFYNTENFIPSYLRVIVNPIKLLNAQTSDISIMSDFNPADLRIKLNENLTSLLGAEYDLTRFRLTRIDCCVNVIFNDSIKAIGYLQALKKAAKKKKNSVRTPNTYVQDADYCLNIPHTAYSICIYDKLYQLKQQGLLTEDYGNKGVLRFELRFINLSTNRIYNELGTDDAIEAIEYFTKHSKELFGKFIPLNFLSGNYYSYDTAFEIISQIDSYSEVKNRMKEYLYLLRKGYSTEAALTNLSDITYEKIRTMFNSFSEADICPIVLPNSDCDGIAGICSVLGIK